MTLDEFISQREKIVALLNEVDRRGIRMPISPEIQRVLDELYPEPADQTRERLKP